jgi:dephospho-CoA kinase
LLVESENWRQQLDKVLVVDCEEHTQISRVMSRDGSKNGWTTDAVKKVISSQASRPKRRGAADWLIYNDGLSLEALAAHVAEIVKCIKL